MVYASNMSDFFLAENLPKVDKPLTVSILIHNQAIQNNNKENLNKQTYVTLNVL